MTTTTKLNSRKLLSQLADSNSSGCLELDEGLVSWKIYFQQGKIKYACCSAQSLDRLKYYLHRFGWKQTIAALKDLPPSLAKMQSSGDKSEQNFNFNSYSGVISWLLKENHLELSQSLKLIEHITKDEVQYCLWLDRGSSSWNDGSPVPSWIPLPIQDSLSVSVSECLNQEQIRLKQWQSCSSEILSVYQRPYFPPSWETKPLPTSGSLNRKTLTELTQVLRGRTSIRQLSILLKKDELRVAQILSPYIDEKIIYLHHAQAPLDRLPAIPRLKQAVRQSTSNPDNDSPTKHQNTSNTSNKTWKIVCIDDSPTILAEIKRFLDHEKYVVTAIDDPVQAVSQIFQIAPDLILLDITMPRINGYKLCGLLRSSGKCDDTPIIMVSGNTGFIDKARAKISGATDYFTKPFTQQGLTQIVEKYL